MGGTLEGMTVFLFWTNDGESSVIEEEAKVFLRLLMLIGDTDFGGKLSGNYVSDLSYY